MAFSEIAAVLVFVVVVLFGIVDAIRTPLIVKRFYRDKNFTNDGKKMLTDCTDARIVDGMFTEHYFSSGAAGVSQCKSWSTDRHKFTLSKATRKRNRAPWSVTVIEGNFTKLSCLILPTVVPEAIAYVGNGENVDFEDDSELANRYHINADNETLIKSVLTREVRAFLLQPDVIYLESTDSQLVIKRNWLDHQVLHRLSQELEIAARLSEQLCAKQN